MSFNSSMTRVSVFLTYNPTWSSKKRTEYLRRHTSSSRPERFFKVRRPNPLHHNHGFINDDYYPPESFSGFLPKTMPIPPSAPSKKHNVYGLQSTNSQRYP
ncbi:hypothetical protein Bca101_057242 [Brassica carinata]